MTGSEGKADHRPSASWKTSERPYYLSVKLPLDIWVSRPESSLALSQILSTSSRDQRAPGQNQEVRPKRAVLYGPSPPSLYTRIRSLVPPSLCLCLCLCLSSPMSGYRRYTPPSATLMLMLIPSRVTPPPRGPFRQAVKRSSVQATRSGPGCIPDSTCSFLLVTPAGRTLQASGVGSHCTHCSPSQSGSVVVDLRFYDPCLGPLP